MRRFFIDQIDQKQLCGTTTTLTGQDARHLKDVLRLDPGDEVCLIDGKGHEYMAHVTDMQAGAITLTILEELTGTAEPPIQITMAQAFLKDKKMDVLIRQLTELGLYRWLPFQASRSVPRPDKKRLAARMERWEKIAQESLKQCNRSRLPEISECLSFSDVLAKAQSSDLKIMFWEKSKEPLCFDPELKKSIQSIFIILGPEGGFTDKEAEAAIGNGFITASLGPRILKAETASLSACTLIQYLFGDMGKNNS
ncbi:MAG: 16S rRNA (uracil(1498)-N(3))-methyltransferase [Proteobacteria bacterium]|nr:16S rRNA (uracil(1498)-N(3))-methyltransferase [Pseudomonadota bacterium]